MSAARLIENLLALADEANPNRGALAHLRRGLDNPAYTLARVGWLFNTFNTGRDLEAALLTAGLFAWSKGKCGNVPGTNFGKGFGSLPGRGDNKSIEKRFIDLLDTDATELPFKLRQVVSLLAQHGIALDWERLYWDLRGWDDVDRDREVQKQWARGFWSASPFEAIEPEVEMVIIESSNLET